MTNGIQQRVGTQTLSNPSIIFANELYLSGTWNIDREYAQAGSAVVITYKYNAKEVYIVADANTPSDVDIFQDGKLLKTITVQESKLYTLVTNSVPGEHKLELKPKHQGVRFYAFTFG